MPSVGWPRRRAGRCRPANPCSSPCRAGAEGPPTRWRNGSTSRSNESEFLFAPVAEADSSRKGIPMNLETHLRAQRDAGRKLLVPYVTGGLGTAWLDVVRAVADAGADAIEVGVPFSHPGLGGRVIQEASPPGLEVGGAPAGVTTHV